MEPAQGGEDRAHTILLTAGPQCDPCVLALAPWRGLVAAGASVRAAAAQVSAGQAQLQVPGSAGRLGAAVRTAARSGISQHHVRACTPARAPRPRR